ncbi:MAG: hypothetical protein LDL41_24110 [Coleofasciculus sp. S288]|nr:hypothetical protein [Coleofasciculus sp. S288]
MKLAKSTSGVKRNRRSLCGTDLTVRKRNLRNLSKTQNFPNVIAEALAKGEPFIYVKIDASPNLKELSL